MKMPTLASSYHVGNGRLSNDSHVASYAVWSAAAATDTNEDEVFVAFNNPGPVMITDSNNEGRELIIVFEDDIILILFLLFAFDLFFWMLLLLSNHLW